jgi:hypothetical protein
VYSPNDSAPTTQPTVAARSVRSSSVRAILDDDIGNADPSAVAQDTEHFGEHRRLVGERLMTQLEMTTSTLSSGSGIASIWPQRNSTLVALASAAFARASSSISSVMSSP